MKKLIVVVEEEKVAFESKEPEAYFSEDRTFPVLIVSDEKEGKLGAFAKWDYWYYERTG